jgi:hypothetical protein
MPSERAIGTYAISLSSGWRSRFLIQNYPLSGHSNMFGTSISMLRNWDDVNLPGAQQLRKMRVRNTDKKEQNVVHLGMLESSELPCLYDEGIDYLP